MTSPKRNLCIFCLRNANDRVGLNINANDVTQNVRSIMLSIA